MKNILVYESVNVPEVVEKVEGVLNMLRAVCGKTLRPTSDKVMLAPNTNVVVKLLYIVMFSYFTSCYYFNIKKKELFKIVKLLLYICNCEISSIRIF